MIPENCTTSAGESMSVPDVSPTFHVSLVTVATAYQSAKSVSDMADREFAVLIERGRFDRMAMEAREAMEAGDLLDL